MDLTDDEKWNVLAARARYSKGLFLYGVMTTGIYCWSNCSSRLPHRKNVRFFETNEEAENAGYRPCKKCRPNEENRRDSQTIAILNAL